ncbi:MAG: aspartate kinase [Alistipes sp.]|nr:aspartate kinase [Alistipes sp.]
MVVYKFGGASVRSAAGVSNLRNIVAAEAEDILVVVSAMGKTTNALEEVVLGFVSGDRPRAAAALQRSVDYHEEICTGLFGEGIPAGAKALLDELRELVGSDTGSEERYDYWYDRIVSYGELVSTTIIAEYLIREGLEVQWLDIRNIFITDNRHRDADIDITVSAPLLKKAVEYPGGTGRKLVITQGFIGGTAEGETTTLGREGSDYSAAVAANILDAGSLTIWKDVDGILNADPKFFTGTTLIPELTYLDAIELAYSGAQVIHPKTIKPLQNKRIPLYVKPFEDPSATGSAITAHTTQRVAVPVLILKKRQVLVSVRPHDFSFVLEDKLPGIFSLMHRFHIRMNMIQSSAVNLSLCVDDSRNLERFAGELRREGFRVVQNSGLELLTIRSYDGQTFETHSGGPGIYLIQKTRRTARILRTQTPDSDCLEV